MGAREWNGECRSLGAGGEGAAAGERILLEAALGRHPGRVRRRGVSFLLHADVQPGGGLVGRDGALLFHRGVDDGRLRRHCAQDGWRARRDDFLCLSRPGAHSGGAGRAGRGVAGEATRSDEAGAGKARGLGAGNGVVLRALSDAVGVLGVLMGVGTAAYAALENWTPFDAWFFSVISLSTVGFGDLHPTTSSSRLFSVFYLLLGTLAFAAAMGQFVEVVAQRQMARKRAELLALEVTPQVIARLDEDGDGKVDRAEYISFMLLQLGHCTQEDLDQINARFHALDRDVTGLLDQNDLK